MIGIDECQLVIHSVRILTSFKFMWYTVIFFSHFFQVYYVLLCLEPFDVLVKRTSHQAMGTIQ